MDIRAPNVSTERLMTLLAEQGKTLRLQVGQVVPARVVAAGRAITLQIGQATVQAQTQLPLQTGQALRLQVAALTPQVVLRVVPDGAQAARALLHQGLRESLPQQLPLAQLGATLHRLAQAPGPLQALAAQTLRALPEAPRGGQAEGLRQLLAGAGLFFERALAQTGAQDPARDLKGMLLRLLARLPQAVEKEEERAQLAALRRETQGALARVQTLQIQPLLREGGERTPLVIEVPVRVADEPPQVLRFEIAEEPPEGDAPGQDSGWSVTLDWSAEPLGPLRATVHWRQGTVGVVLAAQRPATAALVREALPELAQRLEAQGVALGRMECHTGLADAPSAQAPPGALVSTQA